MLSKVLLKLIDKAIIPALLLLASRIVSIILVSNHLDIEYKITKAGFIFSNSYEYTKVNSYSVVVMTFLLLIGLGYVLSKSVFFHDSHIKPSITTRLFSLKAQSLIQNSYEIYTQGAIWLSYAYLLLVVSGIMTMSGLLYKWVFYLILGVTLLATLLLVLDVEEEVDISKNTKESYDMDKSFVEIPGDLE
jgi:uncharacterized membrane protein YphA (DoxX/SURF4 family)